MNLRRKRLEQLEDTKQGSCRGRTKRGITLDAGPQQHGSLVRGPGFLRDGKKWMKKKEREKAGRQTKRRTQAEMARQLRHHTGFSETYLLRRDALKGLTSILTPALR